MKAEEGYIDVPGGKVWYRAVGDNAEANPSTPLLCLHGGPGFTHYYLEPLEALADRRRVIFYDQLGCGRSDRPGDLSLWNVDRFVEELAQVRSALNLDRLHLFGSSWGGWPGRRRRHSTSRPRCSPRRSPARGSRPRWCCWRRCSSWWPPLIRCRHQHPAILPRLAPLGSLARTLGTGPAGAGLAGLDADRGADRRLGRPGDRRALGPGRRRPGRPGLRCPGPARPHQARPPPRP